MSMQGLLELVDFALQGIMATTVNMLKDLEMKGNTDLVFILVLAMVVMVAVPLQNLSL